MTAPADLPRLADLPLPDEIGTHGWSATMSEMAAHIGARDTLRVSEALGGREVYISRDPARSPFKGILSDEQLATIAHVYGGSRYEVTLGSRELTEARRAGVVAAVRAKAISVQDAATICGITRSHMSRLVNHTDLGLGARIPSALPTRRKVDPRQIDLFEPSSS